MEKKSFGESLEAFFAGKGFYIVLFLCVAVIGVSAWAMLTEDGADVDGAASDMSLSAQSETAIAEIFEEYPVSEPNAETGLIPEDVIIPQEDGYLSEVNVPDAGAAVETAGNASGEASADFFVWPVTGEIENPYSMTSLAYNRTMRDWRTHDGLDISAELGAQVKSAGNGTVSDVFDDDLYGTTVVIDHGNGLISVYCNLAELPTVKTGDRVSAGQVIGAVGDSALCEAGEVTHLHFSMALDGASVDPTGYLP